MTTPHRNSKWSLRSSPGWIPWAVGLVSLAPFAPLLAPGEKVLPSYPWSDYTTFQLPVHEFARDEFLSGQIPLWIPWVGNGMPLHAGQQAGLFYPGLTLPLLVLAANSALKLSMFLHLGLAFAGQYLAARTLGAQRPGVLLAAVSLTQSGYLVNHLTAGHVGIVIGASLIPWFLWAVIRLLRQPGPARAGLAATIGAALLLGSHTQIAYYAALLAIAWTLGTVAGIPPWAARRRQLAWSVVAAVLAIGVGAIQALPTFELARDGLAESPRGDGHFASTYPMTTLDWLRMVVPDIAGNPIVEPAARNQYDFFHERVAYLGLLCPFLAVYGLTRLRVENWQWGAAALAATGMTTALADATPWFGAIGQVVPGWYWFRCAGRVFAVVTPLVGLLAARGFDAWLARERPGWRPRWWLLPLGVWVIANVTLLPDARPWEPAPLTVLAQAWARAPAELIKAGAFFGAAAAALAVAARYATRRPAISAGVALAFAFADLGYHNAANFRLADEPRPIVPAELLSIDPPLRFAEATHYPRLSVEELSYARMVRAAVECRRSMVGTNEGGLYPAAVWRCFRAAEQDPPLVLALAGCTHTCDRAADNWKIVPDALPRARFATDRAADLCGVDLAQLTRDDVAALRKGSRRVKIASDEPRRVRMEVEATADGILLFADTFYPGWNCTVDGYQTPIEAAHGVFRAVRLLAGPHVVEMAYEPRSFILGAGISAASIAIVALFALVGWHGASHRAVPVKGSE